MTSNRNLIPPQRKLAATVLGVAVFALCVFHLIYGDVDTGGWSSHDVMIGIFGVLGAGIAFPDPVIAMITAWRKQKPN